MARTYYLGIDIGGTKSTVIAGTENMEILDKIQFDTDTAKGADHTITKLLLGSSHLIKKFRDYKLLSTGISCGGPLDSKKGTILSPPNLPGWDNIPITELFTKRFEVPAYLQNDANACALAEWKYGAGRGTENMIFLTFGTGMGAGLILNGKLYTGINDLAGEVGHIRLADDGPEAYGKKGSFEGFCSGAGIARMTKKTLQEKMSVKEKILSYPYDKDIDLITTKDIARAASMGDETALRIFEISGEYLGRGLSILIDILNPERIVIGSVYARAIKFIEPACRRIIELEALLPAAKVCEIVPAALGDEVGEYACLCVAIEGLRLDTTLEE